MDTSGDTHRACAPSLRSALGILVGTTWTKADGAEDAADPGDTASWLQRLVTHPLQEGSRRDGTRGVGTGTEWPRWLCGHSLSHAKPGKWAKEAIWREKVWKTVYRERQSRMWLQSGREKAQTFLTDGARFPAPIPTRPNSCFVFMRSPSHKLIFNSPTLRISVPCNLKVLITMESTFPKVRGYLPWNLVNKHLLNIQISSTLIHLSSNYHLPQNDEYLWNSMFHH